MEVLDKMASVGFRNRRFATLELNLLVSQKRGNCQHDAVGAGLEEEWLPFLPCLVWNPCNFLLRHGYVCFIVLRSSISCCIISVNMKDNTK